MTQARSRSSATTIQTEGDAVRAALATLTPLDEAARARALAFLAEQLLGVREPRLRGLIAVANERSTAQLRRAS